jgi:hypothetical protein
LPVQGSIEQFHVFPDPDWAGQRPSSRRGLSDRRSRKGSIIYGLDSDGRRYMSAGHCMIVGPTDSIFSHPDVEEMPDIEVDEWPRHVRLRSGIGGVVHVAPVVDDDRYSSGDLMLEELIANVEPNFGTRKTSAGPEPLA